MVDRTAALVARLVVGGRRGAGEGRALGGGLAVVLARGGLGLRGRRLVVAAQGRASGHDRSRGEGRDTRLEPDARATGADRHLGDARRGGLLAAGQPRHERIGRERRGGRAQGGAGAQQQLAQGAVADAQLPGHVRVRAVGHGDGDERGTLAIGQGLDAMQRRAQVLALLDLGLEAERR